eukprot:298034_1
MSSILEELRNKQKIRFTNKFNKLSNSAAFKKAQSDSSLNGFRFQVISEEYIPQIIDTVCYGYSILGGGTISTIFQLTIFDRYKEWGAAKINHLFKTGLMIIVVDRKTNLVAATVGFFDLADQYNDKKKKELSLKLKHKKECSAYPIKVLCKQNDALNKIYNNKIDAHELPLYFGKWCEGSVFTVRPDVKKSGLGFLLGFAGGITMNQIGYEYILSRVTNPRVLLFYQNNTDDKNISKFKLYDFVFNDGTKMKKYFNELQTKWGYNQNQIEQLKKAHIYITIHKVVKLKIDYINNLLKLRKTQKSYKSKL